MSQQGEIVNKEMHSHARESVIQYVEEFSTSLILQSKLIAYRSEADIVLRKHVNEALSEIQSATKTSWNKEILVIIGSAFFGAFAQGFVTELSNGNTTLILVYVILGFVGIFMIFWALRR